MVRNGSIAMPACRLVVPCAPAGREHQTPRQMGEAAVAFHNSWRTHLGIAKGIVKKLLVPGVPTAMEPWKARQSGI